MANLDFPPTSRYYSVGTTTLVGPDGATVRYLCRRLLPPSSRFTVLREHVVMGGERIDRIAAQELENAELFWRLCDANDAMLPDDLAATPGRRLRVTLPEGIPGLTVA